MQLKEKKEALSCLYSLNILHRTHMMTTNRKKNLFNRLATYSGSSNHETTRLSLLWKKLKSKQVNVMKKRWTKLISYILRCAPKCIKLVVVMAPLLLWLHYSGDITWVLAWWHPVGCAAPACRLESSSEDVLHHLHLTSGGGPGGLRRSSVARPSLLAHLVVVGDGRLAQLPFKVQLHGKL